MDPLQPDHARPQPVDRRRVRRRGAPLGWNATLVRALVILTSLLFGAERRSTHWPGSCYRTRWMAGSCARSWSTAIGIGTARARWYAPRWRCACPARMAGVRRGRAGVLAAGEPPVVCGELAAAAAGRIVAWAACSARSAGTAGAACAIAIYAAADVHEHGHHCKHARHARPADAAATCPAPSGYQRYARPVQSPYQTFQQPVNPPAAFATANVPPTFTAPPTVARRSRNAPAASRPDRCWYW